MTTRCGVDDETCGLRSAIPSCCRTWFPVWQAFVTAHRSLVLRNPILRAVGSQDSRRTATARGFASNLPW